MTKTILMLAGLGGVLAFGTACFGLFGGSKPPAAESGSQACAGLSGQAKIDCEKRQGE
jgi:hypothetical protein